MRSTVLASVLLCAAFAAAVFACGGNEPPPATPSATGDGGAAPADTSAASSSSGGSAAATGAPDAGPSSTAAASGGAAPPASADFDTLPKDKKVEIMMTKVVPNVGKLFKEHDAKKYAKFTCKTCHGDVKEKSKEDPHKVLPKLTFSNGGYEKLQKAKPDMVKFMNDKVLPAMADALGEKVADKDGKNGTTCGTCHTVN
jgi:hypothetical protein